MLSSVKKLFSGHFSRLLLINLLWLASWAITGTLFEVYFLNIGLSITEIYSSSIVWFFAGLLLIPLVRKFESKTFMLLGIASTFIGVLLLFFLPNKEAAYAFRFFSGLPHVLFWIPFNTLYYEFRKENNAFMGAIYYSIMPVLSLALPAFAGYIATYYSYSTLFTISLFSYGLTFFAGLFLLEKKQYEYNVLESVRLLSGLRSLIFLEGFAGTAISAVTIDIVLLLYADKPIEFGGFLSLVTVSSVLASLFTAKISDKYKTRRAFLLISAFGFGVSAILASQATDIFMFFIGFSLLNFFRTLFFPLPFALAVDNTKSLLSTMAGRELFLNLGRLSSVIIGYFILINSNIQTVLLFQGAAMLLYIPLFENRKRKLAKT